MQIQSGMPPLFVTPPQGYYYNCTTHEHFDMLGIHTHHVYEVLVHVRGGHQFCIGSQLMAMKPYTLYVIPPGQVHGLVAPWALTGYERLLVQIDPALLGRMGFGVVPVEAILQSYAGRSGAHISLTPAQYRQLRALGQGISAEPPEDPYQRSADLHHLGLLLNQLCQIISIATPEKITAYASDPLVQATAEYVTAHFAENCSLDALARHFNVNKYHLSHRFTEVFGVSLYQFVLMCRVTGAQHLIRRGESLQQTAEQCGFGDYSGFQRAFARFTGVTPRQWKQQYFLAQSEAQMTLTPLVEPKK